MPGDCVNDVEGEAVSASQRLEPMTPRVVGRNPRIVQAQGPDPAAKNLRPVPTTAAESVRGELAEQRSGLDGLHERQESALDQRGMDRDGPLGAEILEGACLRREAKTPNAVVLNDVLRAKLAHLGNRAPE